MRTWTKASAPAALLAVAVMSMGGTAFADTDGRSSVGGGNQINLPVTLPIDISGNGVGVLGDATAGSKGGASVESAPQSGSSGAPGTTSGTSSVLGGNQVNAPITAPVNACGNAISLVGNSDAGCQGGSSVKDTGSSRGGGKASGNRTDGRSSVAGGNQVNAPITAPVNVCGNAIAIFGNATAGCTGGSSVTSGGSGGGAGGNTTSGRSSVGGGNQVVAPITAPINICGNAIAILGNAFSSCKGGSSVTQKPPHKPPHSAYHRAGGGSKGNDTDGRYGVGSGNQVIAPITAPVNVCGNAVGNAVAGCEGGSSVKGQAGGGAGGNTTSGRSSVGGGNQVVAPITAPVNVCGNAAAVLGQAFAKCKGGITLKQSAGKGSGNNRTSGSSSVLGGNQAVAPITAPVNVCGTSAAVLGSSKSSCKGGASVSQKGAPSAGGNTTSGRSSVGGGNQVVAPITAPVNVCGNAVAVLGDAAAGCLGGAHVGTPDHKHTPRPKPTPTPTASTQPTSKATGKAGSPLSSLPAVGNLTQQAQSAKLPVVGDVAQTIGLPAIPSTPGMPTTPMRSNDGKGAKGAKGTKTVKPGTAGSPLSVASPITELVGSTPAGSAVGQATSALPLGNIGLMSAEQPAGLTGMNSGSLFALVMGAMFAASASLFAATRRFRLGRR
ncbi:Small secreted domain [Sinosporangium album]|uniref:Small secreted domain n=1 Tax=Sinosporangium album TaxID=504805 RepID=A0A1G8GUC3_9ACTN|nr:chaplin [Sinosporangium album]SDH97952.1 Small secreted domain [Sinosporangium album]